MVEGKKFDRRDSQIRDNKKILGYAYFGDGTFVNQEILRAGHAKVKVPRPISNTPPRSAKLNLKPVEIKGSLE